MRRVVLVLVPTMHKEALTLTDASLTKSDGSASLLLFLRIDFQSNPFLSQYFDNIIGDIFSHHYHREVLILTLLIPWMNDERMSAHFIQSIGGCIGLCNVQCTSSPTSRFPRRLRSGASGNLLVIGDVHCTAQ